MSRRRPLEAGRPERLADPQARGARGAARREHVVALDAHAHEERRGAGAEDDLDSLLALLADELDHDVVEPPGRVHQLDRTAHRLAVERPAEDEADEGQETLPLVGFDADRANELPRRSGVRGGAEGEREKDAGEHQRDCRIRTSKAHPFSTPVLAVPGSVRVSRSEKRSVRRVLDGEDALLGAAAGPASRGRSGRG